MSFACCQEGCGQYSPERESHTELRGAALQAGWWCNPNEDGDWRCPGHRPDTAPDPRDERIRELEAALREARETEGLGYDLICRIDALLGGPPK